MLVLRRPHQDAVVGMGLDVLLQILGTLERLAAEVALVGLERNVDADVRSNVITLDSGCPARVPLARQVEVVGALPADVLLAQVVLRIRQSSHLAQVEAVEDLSTYIERLRGVEALVALVPSADEALVTGIVGRVGAAGRGGRGRGRVAVGNGGRAIRMLARVVLGRRHPGSWRVCKAGGFGAREVGSWHLIGQGWALDWARLG